MYAVENKLILLYEINTICKIEICEWGNFYFEILS